MTNQDLIDIYVQVCLKAENIMATTGVLTGAHYNAFRQYLKQHGVLELAEKELQAQRTNSNNEKSPLDN